MQERVLEGRNRLPGAQTLSVARFVWNQERPEEQFEDYRHLRTYFKRAEEAVRECNFGWPTDDEAVPPDE
jgi:hypothetical protein